MTRGEKLEKALRDVADILDSFAAMEDEEGRRHAAAWTRRIAANARAALAAPPSGTPGRGIAGRTPEEIARAFHDAYEALAPHFGYRTREASAKPWDEVPPSNRDLMIATVRAVLFEPIGTHPGPAPRPLAETPARCVTCGGSGYLPPTKTPTGATRNVMCPDCAPASHSGDPAPTCDVPDCNEREVSIAVGADGWRRCWKHDPLTDCAPPPASGDARTPNPEAKE
jgi:hypothetical protein